MECWAERKMWIEADLDHRMWISLSFKYFNFLLITTEPGDFPRGITGDVPMHLFPSPITESLPTECRTIQ